MAEQRDSGFELVLSNRQLLSLFFVVVVFFAAFFSVGYVVGFGHGEGARPAPELAEAPPPAPTQEEVRLPDSLLMPAEEGAPEPAAAPRRVETKESPRVVETPPPPKPAPTPAPPPAQQKAAATAAAPTPRPATPPTPRPAGQAASGQSTASAAGYNVQVSAVRVAADANSVASNLRGKGYPAHIEADRGDGWHRVLVGPFASREAAEESRKRLTTEGFNTLLRAP
ncbi:MAG: SPOR domain-containing protein [Acidobacteria bacterium]|nr:SPOR domain-containing protein [Acidobacteriota bacterium]MDA1234752.1 SPOR domain-containing protein [Acidobacteriota bacterium]